MKRITLVALALSLVAVPMAQAQTRQDPRPQYSQQDNNKAAPRYFVRQKQWKKGDRVPDWGLHNVTDYESQGLWRPNRHQQWVKIYDDFLLVSTTTGAVAAVVADR